MGAVGQRLVELRATLMAGASRAAFARRVGLSPVSLGGYELGTSDPSAEVITKIATAFPEADMSWLITGDGIPITARKISEPGAEHRLYGGLPERDSDLVTSLVRRLGERSPEPPEIVITEDQAALEAAEGDAYVAVAYLEDAAAAGPGLEVRDDVIGGYVLIHARVAPNPERIRCLRLQGDSMAPYLPEGSIVAVDLDRCDPHAVEGKVVAARADDGVVVKLWRHSRGRVLLQSCNPTAEPVILGAAEVDGGALIGQVIWAWVDLR